MKVNQQAVLLINTASDPAFIGFAGKYRQIGSRHTISARLLREIEELLQRSKTQLDDVEAIAVAVGPGSFTSLRIGIAAANALAWTHSIPVVEVDESSARRPETFEAFVKEACLKEQFSKSATPIYGTPPSITPLPKTS